MKTFVPECFPTQNSVLGALPGPYPRDPEHSRRSPQRPHPVRRHHAGRQQVRGRDHAGRHEPGGGQHPGLLAVRPLHAHSQHALHDTLRHHSRYCCCCKIALTFKSINSEGPSPTPRASFGGGSTTPRSGHSYSSAGASRGQEGGSGSRRPGGYLLSIYVTTHYISTNI